MSYLGRMRSLVTPRSRAARRARILAASVAVIAGLSAAPALASVALSGLVTDQASLATPRVPGGQCYPGVADPSACRRMYSIIQSGNWIYVGGIVSDVYDPTTNHTYSGFHNLFRFNATTHALDPTWQPQLYRTTDAYTNAAVTGLAASPDGSTIYAAGAFLNVAPSNGAPSIVRKGAAAFTAPPAAGPATVDTAFNAHVGAGGGSYIANDVKYVTGSGGSTLWLGGSFTHIQKQALSSLVSLNPGTGQLTTNIPNLGISGQVTTTTPTKVARIAINQQQTEAAMIGNYTSVGGSTHKEVVILNIDTTTGGLNSATPVSPWNAPYYLDPAQSKCNAKDTWARGVDWSPDGNYFDIAASGGGGFNAYPALCDAFTRFKFDPNASDLTDSTPELINYTGFDSLFTTCDTGDYAYTGGHNKYLNNALYLKGGPFKTSDDGRMRKVSTGGTETHYGIGVISVNPTNTAYKYGFAVPTWNASDQTGRGAGWASCMASNGTGGGGSATGGGVYVGGDAQGVNDEPAIQRLAYFPGP